MFSSARRSALSASPESRSTTCRSNCANSASTSLSLLSAGSNMPAAIRMFLLRSSNLLLTWNGLRITAALEMNTEQTTHRISATLMVPPTVSLLDDIARSPPFDVGAHDDEVDQWRKQVGE